MTAVDDHPDADGRAGGVGDVKGDVRTIVTDSQEAVNTGRDQYNAPVSNNYYVDSAGRLRLLRPATVDSQDARFDWLSVRFVRPLGFDRARRTLEAKRMVMISGPVGSGRRSTSQMLARTIGAGLFHDLPALYGDTREELDSSSFRPGDWLFCALADSTADPSTAELTINTYRAISQTHDCALLITVPEQWSELVPDDLRPLVASIDRPDAHAVLVQHLQADSVAAERGELSGVVGLPEFLGHASMSQIGHLAHRTVEAARLQPTAGCVGWISQALTSATESAIQVAETARTLEGRARALLLAAGLLEGARADAIHEAAEALLKRLDYPAADTHRLDQPGIGDLLHGVGAELDGRGAVRFRRQLAYDGAVRAHFWRNYPDLRDAFRDWVQGFVPSPSLGRGERDRAVDRAVEQCLDVGRYSDIADWALEWTRGAAAAATASTAPLAATALGRALGDDRAGWWFRRRIYDWACDHNLPVGLAQVLVAVCADQLAITHPERAVVRLHHLARHRMTAVQEAAGHRLCQLTERDDRNFRQLLERLDNNLADPPCGQQRQSDVRLFLRLAGARQLTGTTSWLTAGSSGRASFVRCWSAALRFASDDQLAETVECWLDAAVERREPGVLLSVLVDAGDGQPKLIGRVYRTARDWSRRTGPASVEARHATAARLIHLCRTSIGGVPAGVENSREDHE
jgi:hypothetical protein